MWSDAVIPARLAAALGWFVAMTTRLPRAMLATHGNPPRQSGGFAVAAKYDG
jgi:hypothetical protein